MIFKRDEGEHETFKEACKRYEEAAGQLFTTPSKKLSMYEKGAWLLHDKTGLIAIVNPEAVVFGANLRGLMLQTAL